MARPRKDLHIDSDSQRELDKVDDQLTDFENQVKGLTLDEMNKAPHEEREPQTKMSTQEVKKFDAPYIKPVRSINSKERPNPKYEKDHARAWEYVKCIVENNEIMGEAVETWTKKFAGDSADFWKVPVNKPIYIPRLLAKQLSECCYHKLTMEANEKQVTGADGVGTYIGAVVADQVKHRIDCKAVGDSFMAIR